MFRRFILLQISEKLEHNKTQTQLCSNDEIRNNNIVGNELGLYRNFKINSTENVQAKVK